MQKSHFWFLLLLICVSFPHVYGQPKSDVFVSGEGRFSITVSTQPTERKELHYSILSYSIDGESIVWKDVDNNYVEVQYTTVYGEREKLNAADRSKIIADYKATLLGQLKKVGAMTNETAFAFEGLPGAEIRGIAGKNLLTRLFFTRYRFIALTITMPMERGFDPLVRLANTFRFLSKQEYSDALIAENTPKPLPQTGGEKRPQSDAVENKIKGKVRSITEDTQDTPNAARTRSSEELYDENGNTVKTISFQLGYPTDITQWGWIDGDRVSDESHISYGMTEGPNEKQITMITSIMGSPQSAPENAPKRDDRFSYRYTYKYDGEARLTEKTTFQNDGTIWDRDVIIYKPLLRESTRFDEDGAVNSKFVEVLDAAGNILEERRYDHKGKLENTWIYKYEFDNVGNWIVKRTFIKTTVKGRAGQKLGWTSFRQITYY